MNNCIKTFSDIFNCWFCSRRKCKVLPSCNLCNQQPEECEENQEAE